MSGGTGCRVGASGLNGPHWGLPTNRASKQIPERYLQTEATKVLSENGIPPFHNHKAATHEQESEVFPTGRSDPLE